MKQICLSVLILTTLAAQARAARPNYLTAPRARRAFKQSESTLKAAFKKRDLRYPPRRVFIRIFKRERVLELWSRGRGGAYVKVRDYPVCYASGSLGPKRRQGDRQVPEGVYHVNALNPWSSYHLGLGVSYPNRADRKRGRKGKLGGAIMIHGDCVSIGCVAITDKLIEQVYVAAARATAAGQRRIPIHVFPTRLDKKGMAWLDRRYTRRTGLQTTWGKLRPWQRRRWDRRRAALLAFWRDLAPIYLHFETERKIPRVRITNRGRYVLVRR